MRSHKMKKALSNNLNGQLLEEDEDEDADYESDTKNDIIVEIQHNRFTGSVLEVLEDIEDEIRYNALSKVQKIGIPLMLTQAASSLMLILFGSQTNNEEMFIAGNSILASMTIFPLFVVYLIGKEPKNLMRYLGDAQLNQLKECIREAGNRFSINIDEKDTLKDVAEKLEKKIPQSETLIPETKPSQSSFSLSRLIQLFSFRRSKSESNNDNENDSITLEAIPYQAM